ncbi:MAG: DUF998 domain-containing protein [Pirellulales bacterium]
MRPVRTFPLLAGGTIVGVASFAVSVIVLHGLQPELDPLRDAVSYYVHGRGGWLLTAGLLAWPLVRQSSARAVSCPRSTRPGGSRSCYWRPRPLAWGLGGIFSADPPGQWDRPPSVAGAIHGLAAIAAFTAIPLTARLVSRQLRSSLSSSRGRLLRGLAACVAVSYVVFIASLAPVFVTSGPPWLMGLTERILLAAVCAWPVAAALAVNHRSG